MRILDFKVPDFKFPKFRMKEVADIGEVKVDYEKAQEAMRARKEHKNYEATTYKTIKEVFEKSTIKYADRPFIVERFKAKEPFTEITYNQFRQDVINFGTGLNKILNLKDKRVVIIGETTYHWYVSYMTMLCGVGIAVPVDKELPVNEIENVIKRSKATAVIYSTKKKDAIKKVRENLPEVEYFIQMNSDETSDGKEVGVDYIIEQGRGSVESVDNSYMDIEIDLLHNFRKPGSAGIGSFPILNIQCCRTQ